MGTSKTHAFPMIGWWIIYYNIKSERYTINKNKWLLGATVAIISSMLSVIGLYYTYTGAFGIHSVVLDIINLLVVLQSVNLLDDSLTNTAKE